MLGTAAGAIAGSEISNLVSQPLAAALRSPLASGALSGIPGGTVSAEIGAWRQGEWYASAEALKESIHGMMFVGAAFGTGQWLSAQRGATSVTNARYLSDGIGLTRKAEKTPSALSLPFSIRPKPLIPTSRVILESFSSHCHSPTAYLRALQCYKLISL